MSMGTVLLITALLREMPQADASPLERAAWFERKANAFDAIAAEDESLAAEATAFAASARAHAEELRRSGGDA